MILNSASLSKKEIYHIFNHSIAPRPIAWILSDNGDSSYNLAPFSYFNALTSDPPLLMFSIGKKADSTPKDTRANILEREIFVLNIPSRHHARLVSATGENLSFGESETDKFNIKLKTLPDWPLPIVEDIGVAFMCKKHKIFEVGNVPQALIVGQVEKFFINDSLIDGNQNAARHPNIKKLDPLLRLGGEDYGQIGEIFSDL